MTTVADKPKTQVQFGETALAAMAKSVGDEVREILANHKPAEPAKDHETVKLNKEAPMASLALWAQEQTQPLKAGDTISYTSDGAIQYSPVAEMHRAITAPIEKPLNDLVKGLPLGAIAVGGFGGLVVGEVLDGMVTPTPPGGPIEWPNVIVKAVVAVGINQFAAPGLVSREAATAAVVILGAQILRDVLPIDRWVDNIVNILRPEGSTQESLVMRQAREIANRAAHRQGPGIVQPQNDALRAALSP